MCALNRGAHIFSKTLELQLEPEDVPFQIEDALYPLEAHARVRELLDPAKLRDVGVGIPAISAT